MSKPLSGIRVLDLSRLIPGPFCSRILCDLGARVTKVESPGEAGDYLKRLQGTLYDALNRGKKIVELDLKSTGGLKKFGSLVKESDVILESFRPGVLAKLGFSFRKLKKINPKIILASVTGYGQKGPNRNKAGHDLNYMALSGLLCPPSLPMMQWADYVGGGLMGVVAILAALRGKRRQARHLDISMTDSMIFLGLGNLVIAQAGENLGVLNGAAARYQIYGTSDGKLVSLAALEDKFWRRFCETINKPEWADGDKPYSDSSEAVKKELAEIFRSKTSDEWEKWGRDHDLCLTKVLSFLEVVNSPQFVSRKFYTRKNMGERKVFLPRFPFKFSRL